jgi:hypothetical protein
LRRFTPEDDAVLRADYLANVDLYLTAAKIGCSEGVLRQRIYHFHPDIVNTGRTAAGTKALKRYGQGLLQHGATPDEAAANLRQSIIEARTAAKVSAVTARINKKNQALDEMVAAIEGGKDRNEAIFEARMLSIGLEDIASRFGITRERVRQICDKVAFDKAVALKISEHGVSHSQPMLLVVGGQS